MPRPLPLASSPVAVKGCTIKLYELVNIAQGVELRTFDLSVATYTACGIANKRGWVRRGDELVWTVPGTNTSELRVRTVKVSLPESEQVALQLITDAYRECKARQERVLEVQDYFGCTESLARKIIKLVESQG